MEFCGRLQNCAKGKAGYPFPLKTSWITFPTFCRSLTISGLLHSGNQKNHSLQGLERGLGGESQLATATRADSCIANPWIGVTFASSAKKNREDIHIAKYYIKIMLLLLVQFYCFL